MGYPWKNRRIYNPPFLYYSLSLSLPRFLEGYRWQKQFEAFGLAHLVEKSWQTVLEEKEKVSLSKAFEKSSANGREEFRTRPALSLQWRDV